LSLVPAHKQIRTVQKGLTGGIILDESSG